MVLGVAEYFLRRKVRSVLDIGAGEGEWRVQLRKLRPDTRYVGIDPSEYAVRRYGKRRNIRLGSFEDLSSLQIQGRFDLVVCADVLQYVSDENLERGVHHIVTLLNGITFLESYTSADEMEGDLAGWHHRSKRRYLAIYRRAGLVPCGLNCYLPKGLAERAVELELA